MRIFTAINKVQISLLLTLLILTFAAYFSITNGFFQHDEWRAFGFYLSEEKSLVSFLKPTFSHYTPLSELLYYLYFSVFKLNFFWYALFSLFAHLIVVSLAYILFSKIFKNKLMGFLAGLLFALGASGYQATSWIAADINTHGSVIFGLLALIILFNSNFKKIWISMVFFIISLLFKEITIAFIVLLPFMAYIFDRQKFVKNRLNYLKVGLLGGVYFLLRFLMIFSGRSNLEDRLVIESQSFSSITANIFTFPAKIFSQSLIPTSDLLYCAKKITKILPSGLTGLYGTTPFDVFVEKITLQAINWTIFILAIVILVILVKRSKDKILTKVMIFGFLFTVINSFIYVLSPGRSGSIPVVDSRNIYLPSLGVAIFVVCAAYLISKGKKTLILLIILPFIMLNFLGLEKELKAVVVQGVQRREILSKIKEDHPYLPPKVVFYMVSDTPFYGLPESEKIFPFETNLGRALLIWYLPSEMPLKPIVKQSEFLYGLTEGGYLEKDGRGFGYFRDMNQLEKTIKQYKLSTESVISYSYHGNSQLLEDTTVQTRKELEVLNNVNQKQ